jgi:outer membrane receptor protein involved in Fe transport
VVRAPFAAPRLTTHSFAGDLRGEHLGLWASDRVALGAASLELGLRYDRHPATADSLWSPRANLAWRLGERAVARLAWGRFHQSQRPYELQVEDGEERLAAAERSDHWVAGYERLLAANAWGVEAVRLELFHRDVHDPRVRYENLLEPLNVFQEIEPDRVRIAPARARSSGAELLLRGRRGAGFDWWLAYTQARSEDRLDGRWVPRALDQRHTLTAALGWRLPRQWRLDLAWRYHSGWPHTPVRAELVTDPDDPEAEPELGAVFGALRSERFPAYHRLDLRASRGWQVGGGRLTFFVDVQNLYDRANLAGFDVELDDEEEQVLLESERWPGVFPSLGISWER